MESVEILSMTGPVVINSGNDVTLDCYYNYRYGTITEMTSHWTVTMTKSTGPIVINSGNDVTLYCYYNYRYGTSSDLQRK